jgi:hypothetical protein
MDYFATWLFASSRNSKNSRGHLRSVGSRDFARLLNIAAAFPLPPASAPHPHRLHAAPQSTPDIESVSGVLEQLTAQLVEAFDQIRFERDATPRASAAWQKLTGEMLAYARVTALLENMKCGSPSVSNSED